MNEQASKSDPSRQEVYLKLVCMKDVWELKNVLKSMKSIRNGWSVRRGKHEVKTITDSEHSRAQIDDSCTL